MLNSLRITISQPSNLICHEKINKFHVLALAVGLSSKSCNSTQKVIGNKSLNSEKGFLCPFNKQ